MDRQQAHDYAAAMAFAQQQQQSDNMQQHQQHHQQFGGFPPPPPPQQQQFPFQQVQASPFLAHPPHHFPYHHHQQQLHPLPHHLLHLQQPFPPHLPPHLVSSSPFHNPSAPAPPPSDPELHKVIDKLVEYAAKNGPDFEAMIREKQRDNPAYAFLFGGDGHNYYRYKLWISTRPTFPQSFQPSSLPIMHPLPINSPPVSLHQSSFPPFYDHQHHSLPFPSQPQPPSDYDSSTNSFKGLSGPLPSDVASELANVLTNLTGTKESIKGAKMWFMQRSPFAPALAEALRERVLALDDSERQLHIVFLANDILFDSLQRRINPRDLDNEALAFKPVLGSMLARIYHNPHNQEANQSRLQKILQFWASKEVYDPDTIYNLEDEMIRRPPSGLFSGPPKDLSGNSTDQTNFAGMTQSTPLQGLNQWQSDRQRSSGQSSLDLEQSEKQTPSAMMNPSSQFALAVGPQFHPNSGPSNLHAPVTTTSFAGSLPIQTPIQPSHQLPPSHQMPSATTNIGEKLPPYPLFPPGLIPGMVRKMQIGSGVPYSPMSPLDIPTVIPPSTASPSDVLERVSKFFKEIGEVNPSEGPMKSPNSSDDDNDYNMESPIRKGGACIPPPPNLQLDPQTGTYADGTVERKPGSSSSGRLGLGATANPNEISQYDDVYSSYRKQRSTNYHSSMSARAAAR